MASTVNPAVLNALTLQYRRNTADLDDQENRYRINYNNVLTDGQREFDTAAKKNLTGFSDRGMLHAYPAQESQINLRQDYDRTMGRAAQAHQLNLSTIARRRLEAQQDLKNNQVLAALGYQLK
jgi:hypothetical protein